MNASSYLNLSHHSLFLLQAFGFALARMGLEPDFSNNLCRTGFSIISKPKRVSKIGRGVNQRWLSVSPLVTPKCE